MSDPYDGEQDARSEAMYEDDPRIEPRQGEIDGVFFPCVVDESAGVASRVREYTEKSRPHAIMTFGLMRYAVRRWFSGLVFDELSTLEQRLEPLTKSEMFDAELAGEIEQAHRHLVAARRRAAEISGVVA